MQTPPDKNMNIGDSLLPLRAQSTSGVFDLAAHAGRFVVLYFYPKDSTAGCTREGQEFTALRDEFAAAGADIAGVSRDSLRSHSGFCARHGISVELVSDPDEELCGRFGVLAEKPGSARRKLVRSTFLVGPDGRLMRQWRSVKAAGHASEVLAAVRAASAE